MKNKFTITLLALIAASHAVAAEYNLSPSDDYSQTLGRLKPGDTAIFEAGVYSSLLIKDRKGTKEAPIHVKSAEGAQVIIERSGYSGSTASIVDSSYIVFEGFSLRKGLDSLTINGCEHIIINECDMSDVGQAGIHAKRTRYLDILNCTISDTGNSNSQWGEGIYIGSGSYSDTNPFPDHLEFIWIEGNDISDCGNGEAINIKGETFHTTIRNNTIYSIAPGTDTQFNRGAISVEPPSISIKEDWRLTELRDIWIESNEVYNVSGGYADWDNAIIAGGSGVYILDNTIHDCDDVAIFTTSWMSMGLPIYIHGNEISDCRVDITAREPYVATKPPNPNPNHRQLWFNPPQETSVERVSVKTAAIDLKVGETAIIEYSITPSNADVKSLYFVSSNFKAVTVDPRGSISAIANGMAIIDVISVDGEHSASVTVNVSACSNVK